MGAQANFGKKQKKTVAPQRGPFEIRSIWICNLQCFRKIDCSRLSKMKGRASKRRPWRQQLKVSEGVPRGPMGKPRSPRSIMYCNLQCLLDFGKMSRIHSRQRSSCQKHMSVLIESECDQKWRKRENVEKHRCFEGVRLT